MPPEVAPASVEPRPAPDLASTGLPPPAVHLVLSAGLLAAVEQASAVHLRFGVALDPVPWARLTLSGLATTPRLHDTERTLGELGAGLGLARHGGPLSIAMGVDLRVRTFREAGTLVERGLVPVGELGLGWTLPGTATQVGLTAARDLRTVSFFEGETALGELAPWTLRAALQVAVPLRPEKADQDSEPGAPSP